MAPGSVSKLSTPEVYQHPPASSPTKDISVDVSTLSPKIQRLLKKFDHLPWFERTFGYKAPIVWLNVVVYLVSHVLTVYGALVYGPRATWPSWVFYSIYSLFSSLGVTAGVHRYWSHKSYKSKLPFQIMLMLFNCISMQNDIIEWCRDHRLHHKYTETDADPHNAKRGFFFAHMGWLMMRKHPQVVIKGRNVDISDLKRDPVVMFQHHYYQYLCLLMSVLVPVYIPWLLWGEDIVVAFFVLFLFRYVMSLHCTWLVNSAAHLWGEKPYDKHINPSENWLVCLAAIGEGWHNYHHTFPYDYATSEWGPRLNTTTMIIDLMALLGLVYDRKQVSQEGINRVRKRLGDHSNCTASLVAT